MNHLKPTTDESKKLLSILALPGDEGTNVEYYIDAAYVGGVPSEDILNAISSAMVFRGTFDKTTTLPDPANGVLGDVYKFVTDNKDGESVTLPGESDPIVLKRGDIVICAQTGEDSYRWAVVPSGDVDGVLTIEKANDSVRLYNKDGVEIEKLDREGKISTNDDWTDDHTHNIGFEGTHKHGFTGTQANITVTANPTGDVKLSKSSAAPSTDTYVEYTPAGSVTVSHTPAGSVTITSAEDNKTATVTGAISSVSVADHTIPYVSGFSETSFKGSSATINTTYTPEGNVEIIVSNEAGTGKTSYTPKGTINELTFTGTQTTISVPDALTGITIGDHDTFKVVESAAATFAGTQATIGLNKYTPEGGVSSSWNMTANDHDTSTHTFNGTPATINVEGTASVTTSKNVVTDVTTDDSKFLTGVVADKCDDADFIDGISHSYAAPTKKVTLTFTSKAAITSVGLSTTDGNAITSVTPVTEKVASTGSTSASGDYTPKGTISTAKLAITGSVSSEFEGTEADLSTSYTPEGTITVTLTKKDVTPTHEQANINYSKGATTAKYTPAGSINQAVFTGTPVYLGAEFEGTPDLTATGSFTPSGNITVEPIINNAPITHNVSTGTTGVTASYKCLKDLSATFAGTAFTETFALNGTKVYFDAEFDGDAETLSTTYTPAGSVEDTKLEFSGTTGTGVAGNTVRK